MRSLCRTFSEPEDFVNLVRNSYHIENGQFFLTRGVRGSKVVSDNRKHPTSNWT